MSVHSVDHLPPISDDGYKGYNIDDDGQVVEYYDHTNESSIRGGASGISGSRRLLAEQPPAPRSTRPRAREVQRTAGCCGSCVGCLITIGRLPIAPAICFILIWLGTGMFIGAGIAVMDETQSLFLRYGPKDGNPATDDPPEYFLTVGESTDVDSRYELRNPQDLGNRVPEVFWGLKVSFFAIAPFMFIFSLMVIVDGASSIREIGTQRRGCKSSSSGMCCTLSIIFMSYVLEFVWVFFLCFTTLGVYYYRVVMLRCDDIDNRNFSEGIQQNICLDLVQFGLIMFRDSRDNDFGKICGPGDSSRTTVGNLRDYCDNYSHAYRLMLICFAGCLILVIAMTNSLMITTGNYNALQRKFMRPYRREAETVVSYSPATTRRSAPESHRGPPPYVVATSNGTDGNYRRHSKDIELDYMDDEPRSSVVTYQGPKRFEKDSHVGIDYYYKRY